MRVRRYEEGDAEIWNAFLETSRNGTFLADRHYIGYHNTRFKDCSFLFYDDRERLLAILPGNISGDILKSHEGLSYGGLIYAASAGAADILQALQGLCVAARNIGARKIVYKRAPAIYQRYPADEDAYALLRVGGVLNRRDISSTIDLTAPLPWSKIRRRALKKASDVAVRFAGNDDHDWGQAWALLTEMLQTRHGVEPVHNYAEIMMLATRFPDNIKLLIGEIEGRIEAAVTLYISPPAMHAQYIASSPRARHCGALEAVFNEAIQYAVKSGARWFDFGISTEAQGCILNEGLISFKESFGARGVCHDFYEIEL